MANIFIAMPLPIGTRIFFGFLPAPLPTEAARALEERVAVAAVSRALNALAYS